MRVKSRFAHPEYIRNFTFGVEDSLASSVGLLAGIASAELSSTAIVVTGFILIFIEALSMGMGSLLSDQSASEAEVRHEVSLSKSLPAALVMFTSYFLAGFIPIFPYVFFTRVDGMYVSITATLLALFGLGVLNARWAGIHVLKNGLRMLAIGGVVALSGIIAGDFLKLVF